VLHRLVAGLGEKEIDVDRSLEWSESLPAYGVLEVLVPRADTGFDRLTTVNAGGVLGEIAFLDGGPRTAAIRAVTAGEMRRLTVRDFEVLARAIPDLAQRVVFEVARILARRLRLTDKLLLLYRQQRTSGQRITEDVHGAPSAVRQP
jgi:CRP-like cAMP-binding protein